MTRWTDDPTLNAPDGHTWQRPTHDPEPCPNCQCCSKRLCEKAATTVIPAGDDHPEIRGIGCELALPDATHYSTVVGCPCTAHLPVYGPSA
ncbi:hypothetical protein GCM10009759_55350 [Kitasatospora saccharophila]|uniref:4Fe-4S ferredoxin-type domain-containing protein n=1 Tax=Kitasatospora saccharophila TaxID=407973 RepID=A0ABP5J7N1_9ACTN